MMRKSIVIVLILILQTTLYGQNSLYKGVVTDAQYKTPVPYAIVYVEHTQIGAVANNIGEFTFTVPYSLKNSRLASVGEGYRLTYLSPQSPGQAPLHIALQPQETEQDLISPPGGVSEKQGKIVSLLNKAARFVINDWIPLGDPETNKFDFGRIQTFPTYNSIEGVRLRAGVASNSRLSPHFFVKGYLAYGFRDQQFKYRGEAIWSFDKKAYHDEEFPKNNLRLVYEKDLYSPGEMHPRALNDLLLVTYRRSLNEATYRNFAEINYEREYKNGLAHTVWLRRARMITEGELRFEELEGDMILHEHALNTSEMGLQLRYSVREAYVQQKRKRRPIEMTSPVFFLSHTIGQYDYFGEEKPFHRSELSAQKRFLLGEAGRIDAVGEVMKIWNAVPFPLLVYPNQRQRHHIENNAFFLNRALELMADEQYTLRTTFVGDDLLLSKIPLLDRLGIKELLSLRASYGRLSDKNDPEQSSHLYTFPAASQRYGSTPYLEGTIGITNVLGLLRVEYVHRFTYRDLPDALLGKIRVDVTL
ncbi:MAG: hypothetical protein JJE08_00200 [Proteiniphilum sp.]|nr:hypothetical protein [Proteiniphilum sp.]